MGDPCVEAWKRAASAQTRPERGFAGCPTRQTRSYFALALPANWWLLAIDLQLGADLDEPQAPSRRTIGFAQGAGCANAALFRLEECEMSRHQALRHWSGSRVAWAA